MTILCGQGSYKRVWAPHSVDSAHQVQEFSTGNRRADSAISRNFQIRHRNEILDLFLGDERKAAGMKRAAEAFQLEGGKDNDLLQIEKALLLTCIFSDFVTVGCDLSPQCLTCQKRAD